MRIIRGKYKTRRYSVPKNFPSRPTTDFAKEGLFNILEHHYLHEDMEILDLCAGTGNISFEFLSREIGTVIAVDQNFNSIRHIQNMAKELECTSDILAVKADIIKFTEKTDKKYDLIFADPPYAYKDYEELIRIVFDRKLLYEGGVLIVEHGKETNLGHITQFVDLRRYGNVNFSFFEYLDEDE